MIIWRYCKGARPPDWRHTDYPKFDASNLQHPSHPCSRWHAGREKGECSGSFEILHKYFFYEKSLNMEFTVVEMSQISLGVLDFKKYQELENDRFQPSSKEDQKDLQEKLVLTSRLCESDIPSQRHPQVCWRLLPFLHRYWSLES